MSCIEGPVVMNILTMNENASANLRKDNVLADERVRRLAEGEGASTLQSKPASINFWTRKGSKIPVSGLYPPMLMVLEVDRPGATCAYWDEKVAKWSEDGVATVATVATIHCVYHQALVNLWRHPEHYRWQYCFGTEV